MESTVLESWGKHHDSESEEHNNNTVRREQWNTFYGNRYVESKEQRPRMGVELKVSIYTQDWGEVCDWEF